MNHGLATADAYNSMSIQVMDADDTDYNWIERSISDWTAGRVVTLSTALPFTPAIGDKYRITATSYSAGGAVDLSTVTDLIGTPVALDGGAATLGSMLTKMADNNDGADFYASRDSLNEIRTRGDVAWTTGVGASPSETYQVATLTRTAGTNDGGITSDVNVVGGDTYDTGEVTTTTLLEVDATFTADVGMNPVSVNLWGAYDGGGGHYMIVKAYNYIDSAFEEIGTIGNNPVVSYYSFQLGHAHINPATGAMAVKFLHSTGVGIGSHVFIIDKLIATAASVSLDSANITAILEDTTGLNGDVMRGTDGVSLVIPDAAGVAGTAITAAHVTTNNLLGVLPTAIWATAMTDLAAGAPSATASVLTAVNYLYEAWRNRTVTEGDDNEVILYRDDGTTKLLEFDITHAGNVFTKSEAGAAD